MTAPAGPLGDAVTAAPTADAPVEGASFPAAVKFMATLLVLAIVVQGARSGAAEAAAALPWGNKALLLAAIGVVFTSYWAILRSRTSITGTHIRQRWLWQKEVALADIAQLKLIRVRGFEWLIAPRLVVRARGQGIVTFHAADRRVLEAFELLAHGGR